MVNLPLLISRLLRRVKPADLYYSIMCMFDLLICPMPAEDTGYKCFVILGRSSEVGPLSSLLNLSDTEITKETNTK